MVTDDLLSQALKSREMQAERAINIIRGLGIMVAVILDLTYKFVHERLDSQMILWVLASLGVTSGYTFLIHKLTSRGGYRAWIKYLTITVDYLLLCVVFVAIIELGLFIAFSVDVLYGVFIAWLFLVNLLSAFRQGRLVVAYSTTLGSLAAIILAASYLETAFFVYPIFLLVGSGLLVGYLSTGNTRLFVGLRRKEQLMRFLSQSLVESIESGEVDINLGGVKRRVTILMSDIRGFTRFSESRDPLEVIDTLNEYFTVMTQIVFNNGGAIDKFIGDAILAVFGTPHDRPDDAQRAVRTAEQMHRALEDLNRRWEAQGRPQLAIGTALHTGDVVVGNIGSPERMEYTVIGDTVNVTSRIESFNKDYGTSLLMSESTYREVKDSMDASEVGECEVRGRTQPVKLYSLGSV